MRTPLTRLHSQATGDVSPHDGRAGLQRTLVLEESTDCGIYFAPLGS